MTKTELEQLGITPEDVLNKLVERICDESLPDSGDGYATQFTKGVEAAVKKRVEELLAATMESAVLPKVNEMVEGICLQATNSWGEPKSPPLTFTEYLVARADKYIQEPVNYAGKAQGEDSYNWSKSSTRISHMIHDHLKYNIQKAMEVALGNVNSSVRKGLEEAVKIAISNIDVRVNTEVKTK